MLPNKVSSEKQKLSKILLYQSWMLDGLTSSGIFRMAGMIL
jgi:hypothetical protein